MLARFAVSSFQCEIFEKYPSFWCLYPSPRSRFRESRAFGFGFGFIFFLIPICGRALVLLRCSEISGRLFFSVFDLFITTFVYLFINQTTGGLSDPSTLNIINNNNNKYHARCAGVNNRQVGHRASAKKFLLFTERDILRCVYRSAKRSVYTNFMFAFFWTGKMVPEWLGLIDYQPISGISCDVYITWRTALVDYFICRFYHLTYYIDAYRV